MANDDLKQAWKIPEPTLRRLPWYLAFLKLMKGKGETFVSSTQIAKEINVDPSQVAKDLSFVNISGKTRVDAATLFGTGIVFWSSWQPTQDTTSPGIPVSQLRIHCTARPSASSGWRETGVLAGILKIAEPSSSTGTVPSRRLISHPAWIP